MLNSPRAVSTADDIAAGQPDDEAESPDARRLTGGGTKSLAVEKSGFLWAELGLIATTVMWGLNIPIVKEATNRMDPFVFNAARLTCSTIALAFFAWFELRGRRKAGLTRSTGSDDCPNARRFSWSRFLVFAGLTGFLYMIFFMLGVSRTTAGNVALLLSSMPMWTAVLAVLFFGERLRWTNWLGLFITFLGTVTVIMLGANQGGRGFNLSSEFLLGNLLILAAALTWASGTLISKKLLDTVGAMELAFLAGLVTTPLHLLIVAGSFREWIPVILEPAMAAKIIFSGVFSTGLAYSFWHIGVRKLGGAHASVFQNLVTLVAVLTSWWCLGERITWAQILGGVTIIVGLLVMRRRR